MEKKNSFHVETGFVTCEKQFLFHLSDIFYIFSPCGIVFFNKFFIPAGENGFLSSGNSIPLFRALLKFLKFGVTLRRTLFLLVETDFLVNMQICCRVETVFFYSVLLSCKWKLLLKLVERSSLYIL